MMTNQWTQEMENERNAELAREPSVMLPIAMVLSLGVFAIGCWAVML